MTACSASLLSGHSLLLPSSVLISHAGEPRALCTLVLALSTPLDRFYFSHASEMLKLEIHAF